MAKPKTFFEQVPLVVVKKIMEEEAIPKKTVVVKLRRDSNIERRRIAIPRVAKTSSRPNSRVRPGRLLKSTEVQARLRAANS